MSRSEPLWAANERERIIVAWVQRILRRRATLWRMSPKSQIPSKELALPGRADSVPVPRAHEVSGHSLVEVPAQHQVAVFGMGCFWGAERIFWEAPGVFSTAVGYAGGHTPNPTYEEVCSGMTGHSEVVRVVYDLSTTNYDTLLSLFWNNHDPTQGMGQGNDRGTQYRSVIFCSSEHDLKVAEASKRQFEPLLAKAGFGPISTEIKMAPPFYYAEAYHQQYLAKNPSGYCGIGGTGVSCPIGLGDGD